MKINTKIIKRIFKPYNIAISICVIIIIVSAYIIFKPEKKQTPSGLEVVQSNIEKGQQITEKEAKQLAEKQFKKLGEKNIKKDQFEVLKIQRKGEEYYYISSSQNTVEIKINGGEITMINSATIEE